MIKRDVLKLFIQSNQMSINECKSFDEQETLRINFLKRLHKEGKITKGQLIAWS